MGDEPDARLPAQQGRDRGAARGRIGPGNPASAPAGREGGRPRLRGYAHAVGPEEISRATGRRRRAYQQAARRDRGERHAEQAAGQQDDPPFETLPGLARRGADAAASRSRTISAWCVKGSASAWAAKCLAEVVFEGRDQGRSQQPNAPGRRVETGHLIDFEAMRAEPDQLLTYFVWAEDMVPTASRARTDGDLFFAEVRPFEEIFRQGEQPSGGSEEESGEEGEKRPGLRPVRRASEGDRQSARGGLLRETGGALGEICRRRKALRRVSAGRARVKPGTPRSLRDQAATAGLDQATRHMKEAETKLGEAAAPSLPALLTALASETAQRPVSAEAARPASSRSPAREGLAAAALAVAPRSGSSISSNSRPTTTATESSVQRPPARRDRREARANRARDAAGRQPSRNWPAARPT